MSRSVPACQSSSAFSSELSAGSIAFPCYPGRGRGIFRHDFRIGKDVMARRLLSASLVIAGLGLLGAVGVGWGGGVVAGGGGGGGGGGRGARPAPLHRLRRAVAGVQV